MTALSIVTVEAGQSIVDICLNNVGTITAWDSILSANGFTSWTPDIQPGDQIIIPAGLTNNLNAVNQFAAYPLSNFSVANIGKQINDIFALIT